MTLRYDTPQACLRRATEKACEHFPNQGEAGIAEHAFASFLEEIQQSPHHEFNRFPDIEAFRTFLLNLDIRNEKEQFMRLRNRQPPAPQLHTIRIPIRYAWAETSYRGRVVG